MPTADWFPIFTLRKSIATLDKTDKLDAVLATLNPDFAKDLGKTVNAKRKKEVIDAWNSEIAELEKGLGKKPEEKQPGQKQPLDSSRYNR